MNQCHRAMPPNGNNKKMQENQVQQLEQLLKLVSSNFSQTVQFMRMEMENTAMDRDSLTLEAISLQRDKTFLQRQLEGYRKKCKEDFVQSLAGISDVSKAFLLKIDNLLPNVSPFLLTCEKQLHHLDQIRNNCTGLSREVETKFQHYLDKVGSQMSEIKGHSAWLQADKDQLKEDYDWCSYNRSAMALEHHKKLQKTQEKYDRETERMLMDRRRLQGNKELQETAMKMKEGEISILKDKINNLNSSLANCGSRTGMGNSGMSGPNQTGPWGSRHGMGDPGSTGNAFGGEGLSATGQGNRGSTAGTGLGAGTGGWGASATGNGNAGFGNTGLGRAGSSALSSSGAARMNGSGMDSSNGYSLAHINQHLRELQQYSNPNSGSEVSG